MKITEEMRKAVRVSLLGRPLNGSAMDVAIVALSTLIIEECAKVVLDEAVSATSKHDEDLAYNMALTHAADALWALKDET